MDTGVTNIQDDKHATASAEWIQVSRQGTSRWILNIGLFVYVCVCVCTRFCIRVRAFVCVFFCLCMWVCKACPNKSGTDKFMQRFI